MNLPQGTTPIRGFRIPTDLYTAAKAKAASRGETLTDVILKALQRYINR